MDPIKGRKAAARISRRGPQPADMTIYIHRVKARSSAPIPLASARKARPRPFGSTPMVGAVLALPPRFSPGCGRHSRLAPKASEVIQDRSYGSPAPHGPRSSAVRPRGPKGAESPFSVVPTIFFLATLSLRRSLPLGRAAAYQHMVPS
jgi:hypothetical protein